MTTAHAPRAVISIEITNNVEVYHDLNDDEWPFSLRIGDAYETMSRAEMVKMHDAIARLLDCSLVIEASSAFPINRERLISLRRSLAETVVEHDASHDFPDA